MKRRDLFKLILALPVLPKVIEAATQKQDFWAALETKGSIPAKYGMDELGKMTYITRGTTRFMQMLDTRYPKPKTIDVETSYEFKEFWTGIHGLQRKYPENKKLQCFGMGVINE